MSANVEVANCFLCFLRRRTPSEIRIESLPVFASLCGHEFCATATWHGECLMIYRDAKEKIAVPENIPPIFRAYAVLQELCD